MAVVLGTDVITPFTATSEYNSGADLTRIFFNGNETQGISPPSDATARQLGLYINNWGDVDSARFVLYAETGVSGSVTSAIAASVLVPATVGAGTVLVDLPSDLAIATANRYRLAVYTSEDAPLTLWTRQDNLTKRNSTAAGSFNSPPDSLPNGSFVSTDEFAWWLDDGQGAGVNPILSGATAAATGTTTAAASVTSNTAGGTIHAYVSQSSARPPDADIISGSGAIFKTTATAVEGVNNIAITGLTASTNGYFVHMIRVVGSVNSGAVSTAAFNTPGAAPVAGIRFRTVKQDASTPTDGQKNVTIKIGSDVFEVTKSMSSGLLADIVQADLPQGVTMPAVGNNAVELSFIESGQTVDDDFGFAGRMIVRDINIAFNASDRNTWS